MLSPEGTCVCACVCVCVCVCAHALIPRAIRSTRHVWRRIAGHVICVMGAYVCLCVYQAPLHDQVSCACVCIMCVIQVSGFVYS